MATVGKCATTYTARTARTARTAPHRPAPPRTAPHRTAHPARPNYHKLLWNDFCDKVQPPDEMIVFQPVIPCTRITALVRHSIVTVCQ